MANDDNKAKNLATGAIPTGAAPDQTRADAPSEPGLLITDVISLADAVTSLASSDDGKVTKMYNKGGFKGVRGLDGINSNHLAVMAGCLIRQIAINGDGSAQLKAIAGFTKSANEEVEQEKKVSAYTLIANDLGLKRETGETAQSFVARVGKTFAAKHVK
jgi:hypothetical protein